MSFRCFTVPSQLAPPACLYPVFLENMKYLTWEEWPILGIQYFLFLSIAFYLARREVNRLNKEKAYYGYAGQLERQNRRILLGVGMADFLSQVRTSVCILGRFGLRPNKQLPFHDSDPCGKEKEN